MWRNGGKIPARITAFREPAAPFTSQTSLTLPLGSVASCSSLLERHDRHSNVTTERGDGAAHRRGQRGVLGRPGRLVEARLFTHQHVLAVLPENAPEGCQRDLTAGLPYKAGHFDHNLVLWDKTLPWKNDHTIRRQQQRQILCQDPCEAILQGLSPLRRVRALELRRVVPSDNL